MKAQKRQTTFWKCLDQGCFVITISKILLLKLGCQPNAANFIKNERRLVRLLATVMFRGTPCIFVNNSLS